LRIAASSAIPPISTIAPNATMAAMVSNRAYSPDEMWNIM
jgi:hypothetical protein